LDRRVYPNGKTFDLWSRSNAEFEAFIPTIAILHNNLLKGPSEKIRRQKGLGLYYWQENIGSCKWNWQRDVDEKLELKK
jgi:hypothetical protein